jgi:hypothetical protein
MLAQVTTIDEVKHIRDTAEAARGYSKEIGLSRDITVHAAAIKVNAERKLGQLLKTTELAAGAPGIQKSIEFYVVFQTCYHPIPRQQFQSADPVGTDHL